MADLGQDKESLQMKLQEIQIRMRQKQAAIFNLETERIATDLNIKRYTKKMGEFDENIAEIQKQIASDEKDLASINKVINN